MSFRHTHCSSGRSAISPFQDPFGSGQRPGWEISVIRGHPAQKPTGHRVEVVPRRTDERLVEQHRLYPFPVHGEESGSGQRHAAAASQCGLDFSLNEALPLLRLRVGDQPVARVRTVRHRGRRRWRARSLALARCPQGWRTPRGGRGSAIQLAVTDPARSARAWLPAAQTGNTRPTPDSWHRWRERMKVRAPISLTAA